MGAAVLPQEDSTQQGRALLEQAAALQAIGNQSGQQPNGTANDALNLRWLAKSFQPSQQLTFDWVDEASRNSGMTLAPADPALQAHLSLGKGEGLIVTRLDPGCPAAAAGIYQNDVLVRLGEDETRSIPLAKADDLEEGLKVAGDQPTSLVLLRGGRKLSIKVQPQFKVSLGPVHPEPPAYWIGVSAGPLEPALRTQLQISEDTGLIITEVHKDSPAAKAGIQAHDIFLSADGVLLSDPAGLTKLVQSRGEKPIKVELLRKGQKQEIQVTPQRRAMNAKFRLSAPKTGQFDVVLPGALITGHNARLKQATDALEGELDLLITQKADAVNRAASAQGTTPRGRSMEQRLDDLSAQIKELRAAIEALSRAQEKK
jgi:membrane-associated protease RseP (regulator of RpoE activity)